MSGILGNFGAFLVLRFTTWPLEYLMGGFLALGVMGTLLLLALREPVAAEVADDENDEDVVESLEKPLLINEQGDLNDNDRTVIHRDPNDAVQLSGWEGIKSLLGQVRIFFCFFETNHSLFFIFCGLIFLIL